MSAEEEMKRSTAHYFTSQWISGQISNRHYLKRLGHCCGVKDGGHLPRRGAARTPSSTRAVSFGGARGPAVLMNRPRRKGQVPVMLMNGHYGGEGGRRREGDERSMGGGQPWRKGLICTSDFCKLICHVGGVATLLSTSLAPRLSRPHTNVSFSSQKKCAHVTLAGNFAEFPKILDCIPTPMEAACKDSTSDGAAEFKGQVEEDAPGQLGVREARTNQRPTHQQHGFD